MNKLKIPLLALSISVVTGCGGGDSDGGGNGGNYGNNPASESHTRAVLKAIVAGHDNFTVYTEHDFPRESSNHWMNAGLTERNDEYKCQGFCSLDQNPVETEGVIWRHDVSEDNLVPVYYAVIGDDAKEEIDPRVTEGLKGIEAAIDRKVFEDKGFIRFSDADVTNFSTIDYSDAIGRGKGGLIISVGTAHQVSKNGEIMCGSVTSAPYIAGSPNMIVDTNGVLQSDKGWVWLNLGNDNCGFDTNIVKHELAHYFMQHDGHFDGFGENGDTFSESTEAVLHTIYNNAIGAPVESMSYTWDAK
ncbi:hypothetical protein BIZ37_02735 [Photobacterium sp. BZF1]|uniref:hypothetical protein n=1 Tax=Photobacterium sp. BZF1 TaxID=1904457 RepID=UPI001653CE05|nr:hypothetical protein [Photobacterium sp. BZF1]MBC7001461.1 hypothetical protein [Photobacterium sp. BZF1]